MLWISLGVVIAGVVWDQRWHGAHDANAEFVSFGAQAQAHWLLWLGVIASIVVAVLAHGVGSRLARYGSDLVVAGGLAYAAVSVWHSWEHAQERDPSIPHVLLIAALVAMLVGGIATLTTRRTRPTFSRGGTS